MFWVTGYGGGRGASGRSAGCRLLMKGCNLTHAMQPAAAHDDDVPVLADFVEISPDGHKGRPKSAPLEEKQAQNNADGSHVRKETVLRAVLFNPASLSNQKYKYSRPRFKDAHVFFRASLTRGIVF